MAREWRGCRGSSWGAPAIPSFRVVYGAVLGPPAATPGHHTLLQPMVSKVLSDPAPSPALLLWGCQGARNWLCLQPRWEEPPEQPQVSPRALAPSRRGGNRSCCLPGQGQFHTLHISPAEAKGTPAQSFMGTKVRNDNCPPALWPERHSTSMSKGPWGKPEHNQGSYGPRGVEVGGAELCTA